MPTDASAAARAFPPAPRVDRYFGSASSEAARRRLAACLERGEGVALLLGAAGCGKTMLLEVLAAGLAERLRVVRLAGVQLCTRRTLLQAILHGLGEPFRGLDEGELRLALADTIADAAGNPQPIALLVDEAQSLPVRLMEELRQLSNAAVDGEPRLRLLLAGPASLDERFTAPELESFNQRIAARCYLSPMSREETIGYARAHVATVGGDPDDLFAADAYEALFQASDGAPRLVNQIGDRALVLAVESGEPRITGDLIQQAWSDLHQLAAPWHTPAALAPQVAEDLTALGMDGATIEFGLLDDELDADDEPTDERPTDDDAFQPSTPGAWNADTGLSTVADALAEHAVVPMPEAATPADDDVNAASAPEADDADLNGCVAYAFAPAKEAEPAAAPADEPETTETTPPAEVDSAPEAIAADAASEPMSLANDPFNEAFDEEEVVLDRQPGVEAVLSAGSARVTNRQEIEFGRMFEALTPAVESLIHDVETSLDPPHGEAPLCLVEPGAVGAVASADKVPTPHACDLGGGCCGKCGGDEPELLVIEDEPAEASGEVHRQEYAQLFALLRQG